ncbi:iron-containing alcohol dehydrogenase family protein [Amycolatopsis acidicola]|uniref:iron-containing alcohol dehydrogenase family protein n=1 Tax=Amycolatopsis acidicola TaxID=2596893 RepID=UPI00140D0367|nr:iron-containing alcohol dehydrogenase [Amycolatopsis acidicola]
MSALVRPPVRIGPVTGLRRVLTDKRIRRLLVVTDAGVSEAGWADLVAALILASNRKPVVWRGVHGCPGETVVERCAQAYRSGRHDALVAVGGGSVIDAAKAAAGLLGEPGSPRLAQFEGLGQFTGAAPPVFAVPTTPGGAEVTAHAVIAGPHGRRYAVSGLGLRPSAVLLDPALAATAPREVVLDTALDSLLHAIEAFFARAGTPVTSGLALRAVGRITRSLQSVVDGQPGVSRELGFGCLLASVAMANTNAGVVHALGYPLTSEYGLSHGRANAVVAPAALSMLGGNDSERHGALLAAWHGRPAEVGAAFAALLDELGVPTGLDTYCVPDGDLPRLAGLAATYRPVLENTPVAVTKPALLELYRRSWPAKVAAAT